MFGTTESVDDYRDYRPYVDPEPFSDVNEKLDDWTSRKTDGYDGIGLFARNAVLLYELVRQQIAYKLYDSPDFPKRAYRRQDGDCKHQSVVLASLASAAKNLHDIRFTYVTNHVLLELGTPAADGSPREQTVQDIRRAYREYFDREIGDLHWEVETNRDGVMTAWFVADPTAERNGYFGDLSRVVTSDHARSTRRGWEWTKLCGYREVSSKDSRYDLRS